jgi:hypothetical protein
MICRESERARSSHVLLRALAGALGDSNAGEGQEHNKKQADTTLEKTHKTLLNSGLGLSSAEHIENQNDDRGDDQQVNEPSRNMQGEAQ